MKLKGHEKRLIFVLTCFSVCLWFTASSLVEDRNINVQFPLVIATTVLFLLCVRATISSLFEWAWHYDFLKNKFIRWFVYDILGWFFRDSR